MIVGNVEEYIDRCLTSFAPIADEICIVRAIGNQVPDKTLDIAREKFGARVGEYKNAPGHEDWPHVDSFAAARQQSFDMAGGEYCFWCDTDDVLEAGSEIIREHAERGGYPLYLYPYKIFGRGVVLPRERMMIRGGGKWRFPVHECYTFPVAVEGVQDDRVIITHLPHLTKGGSNERNLRILESIPEAEMTAGLWYHLYGALGSAGRHKEAIAAARKAVDHPDIGRPEKYELYIDLARMAKDPKMRAAFLHQAYMADPQRREALGLLVGNALDYGHNADALAYARQMMATVKPAGEAWNDRAAAYGWLGVDIYTQALRMNGEQAKAEALRVRALEEAGGPTIALIHATRGRAQQASIARKRWIDLANEPDRIEHIFVFDSDDEESQALRRMHHFEITAGGGCVAAWNNGALATRAPVIVQLSDDWTPIPQWDKIILDRLEDVTKPAVLAISDGHRKDDLLCMAICTRAYWEQDYFLFHPRFTGVYSDNYFTDVAYKRGQVIEARDIVFTHNHPAFGTAEVDRTYAEQNAQARYVEGKAVYDDLTRNADSDFSSVPGFFNYWPLYRQLAGIIPDGGVFVEVGSWLGRSLIFMAQELKRRNKRVKLYAVDHFRGESNQKEHEATVKLCGGNIRRAFDSNVERCSVADMIDVIDGDSAESAKLLADGSVDACFIDAAHDYESVKRDILAWRPKIKPNGILSGHDADYPDVQKAVLELEPKANFVGCLWLA